VRKAPRLEVSLITLLVIVAWIIALVLVVGLCVSARIGDARLARMPAMAGAEGAGSPAPERPERASVNAVPQLRTLPADAGASLVGSDGVAA
jgi:hypothetical protein